MLDGIPLSEREKELIRRDREVNKSILMRKAKQKACSHDWTDMGEHHNETYFKCFKCGKTKFE